jgi:hypothetical protein
VCHPLEFSQVVPFRGLYLVVVHVILERSLLRAPFYIWRVALGRHLYLYLAIAST